jgi:hypothetical protein
MTPEYHAVASTLGAIPPAQRDRLTTWLWQHVGPFDTWTPEALDAALQAVT